MALNQDPWDFSPEVKRRLGNWDEIVVKDGVTPDLDPLDPQIIYEPIDPLGPQSVPVRGSKKPGYSEVYRNVTSPSKLVSTWHPKIQTYYDAMQAAFEGYAARDCLGQRYWDPASKTWSDYKFETYRQIAARRDNYASGLVHVVKQHTGMDAKESKYVVASYGPNSVNWVINDFACVTQALPTVCLYDTLGPGTTKYILEFTKSPVVVSTVANIPKLLRIKPQLPHLKVIIAFNGLKAIHDVEGQGESKKDLLSAWAEDVGVTLYGFDEIEAMGAANPRPHNPPKRNDIYTINFTSGTTGNPKGVLLSHVNVLGGMVFLKTKARPVDNPMKQDTSYSCLPLAHISERMSMLTNSSVGTRIGFPHGPVTVIFDDIANVHPSQCTLVPRILNRMAAQIKAATVEAPGKQGEVCRMAVKEKLEILKKTGEVNHPKWDRVISENVRRMVGLENMRNLSTGAAPLSPDTQNFLKVILGLDVVQGYGLTESTGGICASVFGDPLPGSCGPTNPTCEVRLRDLSELGYTSDDKPHPRGEIMLRGPPIFRGYYKEDQKTKDAFDEDGWFHTGDVGRIDEQGRIFIIDRVKHFFKLAQGEYIAPEKIENVYQSRSTMISQIFIHGTSTENYLVAIVGVNPESFSALASKVTGKNVGPEDHAGLADTFNDRNVRRHMLAHLNDSVEEGVLNGFEKIRNVKLFLEPLRLQDGTITESLKIKRNIAARHYDKHIQDMYKEGHLDKRPVDKRSKM